MGWICIISDVDEPWRCMVSYLDSGASYSVALSSSGPSRMPHWDLSAVQGSSVGIPCVGCLPMPVLV